MAMTEPKLPDWLHEWTLPGGGARANGTLYVSGGGVGKSRAEAIVEIAAELHNHADALDEWLGTQVKVVRVPLAGYRADPLGYERMAGPFLRVIVELEGGGTYCLIGGR